MNRTELLGILKECEPALATNDLVPVLQNFLFDGKNVLAHDGIVMLSKPTDFLPGLGANGKLLLQWLAASRSLMIEADTGEDEVTLKAGRSKLRLPIITSDDFSFEMPKKKARAEFSLDGKLLKALRAVAVCMGSDPAHPWRLGITSIFGKGSVTFFSTDNIAASRAKVKMKGTEAIPPAVLPYRFVELLLSLVRAKGDCTLRIGSDWVEGRFSDGLRLWTKTHGEAEPRNYESTFEMVEDSLPKKLVEIPKGFRDCIGRMLVVLAHGQDKYAKALVAKGKLRLTAESAAGEIRDLIKLTGHENSRLSFYPDRVKACLSYASKMALVEESCVYLGGDTADFVISAVNE